MTKYASVNVLEKRLSSRNSCLTLPLTLRLGSFRIHAQALCDSGASSESFIDETFALKHGMEFVPLRRRRALEGFDGTLQAGTLTHMAVSIVAIGKHVESLAFYVTHLKHHSIILGHPWLTRHNPFIDWKKGTATFASEYCMKNCNNSPTQIVGDSYDELEDPADPGYESTPDDNPESTSDTDDSGYESALSQAMPRPKYRSPSSRRTSTQRRIAQSSQPPVRLDCVVVGAETFTRLAKQPDAELFECSLRDLDRLLGYPDETEDNPVVTRELPTEPRLPTFAYNPRLSPEENHRREEVHAMNAQVRISVSAEELEAYRMSKDVDPAILLPKRHHQHLKVFRRSDSNELPPHRSYDHAIDLLPGKEPPYGPLYSMTREENEELRRELHTQLSKGFIRASRSPAASPVLFVKKPGGGLRFCVDYRGLNEMTVKNRYPLPLITETLARLSSAKVFTKLDIISAFNRLRIKEGDEWKTAFRTRFGLFEYLVMPFGLCNGPATFQHYINDTLREFLDVFCTAYLDDILIYSDSVEEHEIHVNRILDKLEHAGLQIDITKCEFYVTEVSYLGLIVTTDGIKMDPKKVDTIVNWPVIQNVKDVQSFLGFANFYRRFIYAFSKIAAPLTALTKKDCIFQWTLECQQAFDTLRRAFTSNTVLMHYDPDRQTVVETDASDYVSGGILSQYDDSGTLRPVAYFSKKHNPAECNYEIYDKELMAIVRAFEEWRPELEGAAHPIKVITDHKNLEYFTTTKQLSRRQARWSEFLSRFQFQISYRPGKQGGKPDALTRRSGDLPQGGDDERIQYQNQTLLKPHYLSPEVAEDLANNLHHGVEPGIIPTHIKTARVSPLRLHLYRRTPSTLVTRLRPAITIDDDSDHSDTNSEGSLDDDALLEGNQDPEDIPTETLWENASMTDQFQSSVLSALRKGQRYHRRIQLADCTEVTGKLYYRGRQYVPKSYRLRLRLLQQAHESPSAGHPGKSKTFELISRTYWWPNLYRDVTRFTRNCHSCRRAKHPRQKYEGWLRSLPVPERRWQDISVDYVGPLPPSTFMGMTYRYILVFVDRLTKMRHFLPTQTMEPAEAANSFFCSVYRLHGLPVTIVSDRGRQFTSKFWQVLCQRLKIDAKLSTAFHPETDGQTEIANAFMNQYLRQFVNYAGDDWAQWLPSSEFAANNSVSATTNTTPFFANSGQHPRLGFEPLPEGEPGLTTHTRRQTFQADEFATKMEDITQHLREEMIIAQAITEDQSNTRRRPARTYKENDMVWLSTKNLERARPAAKLDHLFDGPFRIARVTRNPLVVKLDLPPEMQVHPYFHVNLLQSAPEDPYPGQRPTPRDPVPTTQGEVEWFIKDIVDSKFDYRHRPALLKYRVHWDDNTFSWEPWNYITNAPHALEEFHRQYPDKPGPHVEQ